MYVHVPRPRYLPTVDDPPSRVAPRSPRGSSPPSRSAPFARCCRHFRSQYHLPPATRPPEAYPRSCVSKHQPRNVKNTLPVGARDATKEAESFIPIRRYIWPRNERVASKKREEDEEEAPSLARVSLLSPLSRGNYYGRSKKAKGSMRCKVELENKKPIKAGSPETPFLRLRELRTDSDSS